MKAAVERLDDLAGPRVDLDLVLAAIVRDIENHCTKVLGAGNQDGIVLNPVFPPGGRSKESDMRCSEAGATVTVVVFCSPMQGFAPVPRLGTGHPMVASDRSP